MWEPCIGRGWLGKHNPRHHLTSWNLSLQSTMPDDPPHSIYTRLSQLSQPPELLHCSSSTYVFPTLLPSPTPLLSPGPPKSTSLSRYPAPQKAYLHRKPPRSGFRPNEAFRRERLLKRAKAITPIGESYTSLFERLKHAGQIEPLPRCTPNPCAMSFDPTARCAYHSNVRGYSIENCHDLKREVERMIQEGRIVINDIDRGHVDPLRNLLTKAPDVEMDSGIGKDDATLSS